METKECRDLVLRVPFASINYLPSCGIIYTYIYIFNRTIDRLVDLDYKCVSADYPAIAQD